MTTVSKKVAFIGGGNMAGSIIGGLLSSGWHASNISVAEPNLEQREKLYKRWDIACFADNLDALDQADVVILATKPQVLKQAVSSIKTTLSDTHPLLISVAAGIPCRAIFTWVGVELPLVRVMPNTPALINQGMSGLFATPHCTRNHKQLAESLVSSFGEYIWVDKESLIDVVTGISGSGPAYFFKLMEIMVRSAEHHGISEKNAEKMVFQTALGAAKLVLSSAYSAEALRKQVTSPGGTTEAGITTMEQLNLDSTVEKGINAAIEKSEQLAQLLGK